MKENKKEITIDELKKIELNILLHVDEFCRNHDIKYTLGYGTLIGAVRHKGFIPWDDDIDICMLREDYDKFEKVYLAQDHSQYKLLNCQTAKNYSFPFIKISDETTILRECGRKTYGGIYIDIFPLDYINVSQNRLKELANKKTKIVLRDAIKNIEVEKYHSFLKRLLLHCYILIKTWNVNVVKDQIKIRKIINKLSNGVKADSVGEFTYSNNVITKFPLHYFENITELEFEGYKFMAPTEYDKILTAWYGDYMKFPSPENRNSGHSFVVLEHK